MNISDLTLFGRKQWVSRRWEEYENSSNTIAIEQSEKVYYTPTDESFEGKLDKGKWKTSIDRKVNYLLARSPVLNKHQDLLDDLLPLVKKSATEYLLRGSLIWLVQGDGEKINPQPTIMNDTIAIYSDEYRKNVVAYIRRYVEIVIEPTTGVEEAYTLYEVYYENAGSWSKDVFSFELDNVDTTEVLPEPPKFIELGKTGDAPLYAYVEGLLRAWDNILRHQDSTVVKNTQPLVEVRGYTGTSNEELEYAIDKLSIVKVDGTGGVALHQRQMDSPSIDVWARRIALEIYEATATVGKENELQYAQSGKAMDRLFVDMENSARELAAVLEEGLRDYFAYIGYPGIDVIWNTDRPIDDVDIISAVQASRGLVSDRTLLEQHPWVDDVDEELRRLEEDAVSGFDEFIDEERGHGDDEYEWEEV